MATTKKAAVAEAPAPAAPAKAKAPAKPEPEPEPVYVTSTQLAAECGVKSTILRRWLRTLPQFQDGGYTRYKWEPGDPFLETAVADFQKYQHSDEDRKAKRLADLEEKKAAKKAAAEANGAKAPKKGKAKAQVEEEEVPEEEEEFEDDEEAEEIE